MCEGGMEGGMEGGGGDPPEIVYLDSVVCYFHWH